LARTGGAVVKAPRSRTARLERWSKSAEFRKIALKSAKANLAKFNAAPRCGAARKRDGEPCRNPAMKNGRCDWHGGKTPSGRQWHVVQFPDCSTPTGLAKFNRKLHDRERYAEQRAARLAAMTPEQRAKHDAWHRTHAPGAAALRDAERVRRGQSADAKRLLAQGPLSVAPGTKLARVRAALATTRARLASLEARTTKPTDEDEGIFS
jgi:hypothetical protein